MALQPDASADIQSRQEKPKTLSKYQSRADNELLWQKAYEKILAKNDTVSVEVTQCIFTGSPEVGKSALKHLLVHDVPVPKAMSMSNATVMDTPQQLHGDNTGTMTRTYSYSDKSRVFTISFEQYAKVGDDTKWKLVSNDIMGRSLHSFVSSKAHDQLQPRTGLQAFLKRVFTHRGKQLAAGDSDADIALLDKAHASFQMDMQEGDDSIELKDASFIHLLDAGGQPSFQDALPLLVATPCTYIQVFNAARNLDQPVPMTYHPDEKKRTSKETGWEMMLRSFSTLQTMDHKCSKELETLQQEEGQLPQLRIFVVGTFRDQLVEDGKRLKEAKEDISKHLEDLRGKRYYRLIETNPESNHQPFFLVSNVEIAGGSEEDETARSCLRDSLCSARSALKHKVPVAWFMCEQITQRAQKKFFRVQDLKAFCMKNQLIANNAKKADKQFRSLLQQLSLLGFYTFFNLKNLAKDESNFVCTDTGVFLMEVSKLLAVQSHHSPAVEEFKRSGIITNDTRTGIFEELGIRDDVDPRWFLAALEHVGLMARNASNPKYPPSYFMPLALPEGKTKLPDPSTVAPLCFTFKFKRGPNNPNKYMHLPRGMFCRLAVELSNGPWEPIPSESDRTTVKFYTDTFELYLTEAPEFIILTPVLVEELDRNGKDPLSELHELCKQLYETLEKSIISSAKDVLGEQFSQTAKIVFGFDCEICCGTVAHLASDSENGKSLICQASKKRKPGQKIQQRIWFSPVSGAELVKADEANIWMITKKAYLAAGGHPPTQSLGGVGTATLAGTAATVAVSAEDKRKKKVSEPNLPGENVSQNETFDSDPEPTLPHEILSQKVYDRDRHLMLLRIHVSRNAADKWKPVLEGIGFDSSTINACKNEKDEEAVQTGLTKWIEGKGQQPPTWRVLLEAMKYANIGVQYRNNLRTELGLPKEDEGVVHFAA